MVDHPLVADDLRRYIQRNKIEETLNQGLNEVLATLPQDPFSQLAATLIDVSSSQRQFPKPKPFLVMSKDCAKTTDF